MGFPGIPGGLIIYQGHLFALKGHLCATAFCKAASFEREALFGHGFCQTSTGFIFGSTHSSTLWATSVLVFFEFLVFSVLLPNSQVGVAFFAVLPTGLLFVQDQTKGPRKFPFRSPIFPRVPLHMMVW